MRNKQYITLKDALGEPGKALLDRDLETEYKAGKLSLTERLHLEMEKKLVAEWRSYKAVADKFLPVQFERTPDEGLL